MHCPSEWFAIFMVKMLSFFEEHCFYSPIFLPIYVFNHFLLYPDFFPLTHIPLVFLAGYKLRVFIGGWGGVLLFNGKLGTGIFRSFFI